MEVRASDAWARIRQLGFSSVQVADLLCLVLSREERDLLSNEAAAKELAKHFPGSRIGDLAPDDLNRAAGLEPFEAARVLAAMELGRRAAGQGKQEVDELSSPEAAYQFFRELENERQEHFRVAFLNSKNRVIAAKTIHVGTLNMSVVGPREVFREAVRHGAAAIVLAHNHPSGDPTPSPEDVRVTEKLIRVGEELDIPVHDHVVIGDGRFVSMYESGLLR